MEKGDRVRLSEVAKRANVGRSRRGGQDREGTVVSVTGWITVHWDGLSPATTYGYHPDYISPVVPNGYRGGET